MTRWLVVVWLVLAGSGAVSAQTSEVSDDAQAPPQGRFDLSTSLSLRAGQFTTSGLTTRYGGIAPAHLHLGGSWFLTGSRLGAWSDFSYEWFTLDGPSLTSSSARMAMRAFRFTLGGAARFRPSRIVTLEAQLGYGFHRLPAATVVRLAMTDASVTYHGPVLGAALEVRPRGLVSFGFKLNVLPLSFRASSPLGNGKAGAFVLGAHAAVGSFRLNRAVLRPLAEYELLVAGARGNQDQFDAGQVAHRLGVGLRVELPDPKAPVYVASGPGEIRGKVLLPGGSAPASGAEVTLAGGQPVRTDEKGEFSFDEVTPGTATVTVALGGFGSVSRSLTVASEETASVLFTLEVATGPGSIQGVITMAGEGPDGKPTPVADVSVQMDGSPAVRTGPDGRFVLEKAGPGPVAVKIRGNGFQPVDEVVAVPPQGVANLDVTLKKAGVRTLASIRGRVRAISGAAVPATLTISEAKVRTATDKRGAFHVRLAGGRYTIHFEAPGFYKQTKTVEVADGDQAIFYIDLTPVD